MSKNGFLNKIEEKIKKKQFKEEIKECIEEHDLVGKVKYEINSERKRIKREKNRVLNEPPHLETSEEIGNSITHGVGALISIAAFILMLVFSKNGLEVLSACFYGISMIITMTMSCLYHAFKKGLTVKRIWRRFDYASIYLLIGGTFSPLFLLTVGGALGIVLFCVYWAVFAFGITMVCIFGPGRLKGLHFSLYFAFGWIGLLMIPYWVINGLYSLLIWILAGGVIYTLGMIPFLMKRVKNAHFIWHFFVLGGAIVQWLGIFLNIYCK